MFVIENVERLADSGNKLNRRVPVKTQRVTFGLDARFAHLVVVMAITACSVLVAMDGSFAAEDSARNDAAGKYVSTSGVLAKSVCVVQKEPFPEPVLVSYELTDTEKRAIDAASSVLTDKMLKVDESTRRFISMLFEAHEMEVNGLFCELVRLELTQADRLNAVEWNGLVAFNVEAMRTRDERSQAWGDWVPGGSMKKSSCFAVAQVRKVRGSFTVEWENFHYTKPAYIERPRGVPASQQQSGGINDPGAAWAVIEKAWSAMGGQEKLSKAKGVRMRSEGNLFSQDSKAVPYRCETFCQLPSQFRNRITMKRNGRETEVTVVVDDTRGWQQTRSGVNDLTPVALLEAREGFYGDSLLALMSLGSREDFNLTLLGEELLNGKAVLGVQVASPMHRRVKLLFDSNTHLLVGMEQTIPVATGKEPLQRTIYNEFKNFGGLTLATKIAVFRDGSKYAEAMLLDASFGEEHGKSLFARP